jgi:phytoene desaturase
MKSAIVIGAGIGGLATAGRLAREGYRVDIFEKSAHPGGRVSVIEKNGFRFDTGPTLFLMPAMFSETYQALGEKMGDHLDLVRIDPTYRVHFQDGTSLDLTADLVQMREQLDSMEPGAFAAYLEFLAEGARHYHLSLKHFVGRNFDSIWDYFSLSNLPLLFSLKALIKHHANTSRYFDDPRLRAAFSFQNMYLGLSPFDAPATYSLLQYTELAEGIWFPRGGMFEIISSLVNIVKGLGVQIHTNAPVARIDIDQKAASGLTLKSGEQIKADVVIANADLPYVYAELLPDNGTATKLLKKKYTSSALMFYWGIKGERSKELLHHNVFLADQQYKASFDNIFQDLTLPSEPSFYINAPTRTDGSFAPEGGDALMVLVPVGHMDTASPQDWSILEDIARKTVLEKLSTLGLANLEEQIVFEAKWGPPYYRKALNLAKGSAFGLSHNFTQVGYLRPHNRHPQYKNLYFVGASTHPGTGLPIVLISARLTTERILKEQRIPESTMFPIPSALTDGAR